MYQRKTYVKAWREQTKKFEKAFITRVRTSTSGKSYRVEFVSDKYRVTLLESQLQPIKVKVEKGEKTEKGVNGAAHHVKSDVTGVTGVTVKPDATDVSDASDASDASNVADNYVIDEPMDSFSDADADADTETDVDNNIPDSDRRAEADATNINSTTQSMKKLSINNNSKQCCEDASKQCCDDESKKASSASADSGVSNVSRVSRVSGKHGTLDPVYEFEWWKVKTNEFVCVFDIRRDIWVKARFFHPKKNKKGKYTEGLAFLTCEPSPNRSNTLRAYSSDYIRPFIGGSSSSTYASDIKLGTYGMTEEDLEFEQVKYNMKLQLDKIKELCIEKTVTRPHDWYNDVQKQIRDKYGSRVQTTKKPTAKEKSMLDVEYEQLKLQLHAYLDESVSIWRNHNTKMTELTKEYERWFNPFICRMELTLKRKKANRINHGASSSPSSSSSTGPLTESQNGSQNETQAETQAESSHAESSQNGSQNETQAESSQNGSQNETQAESSQNGSSQGSAFKVGDVVLAYNLANQFWFHAQIMYILYGKDEASNQYTINFLNDTKQDVPIVHVLTSKNLLSLDGKNDVLPEKCRKYLKFLSHKELYHSLSIQGNPDDFFDNRYYVEEYDFDEEVDIRDSERHIIHNFMAGVSTQMEVIYNHALGKLKGYQNWVKIDATQRMQYIRYNITNVEKLAKAAKFGFESIYKDVIKLEAWVQQNAFEVYLSYLAVVHAIQMEYQKIVVIAKQSQMIFDEYTKEFPLTNRTARFVRIYHEAVALSKKSLLTIDQSFENLSVLELQGHVIKGKLQNYPVSESYHRLTKAYHQILDAQEIYKNYKEEQERACPSITDQKIEAYKSGMVKLQQEWLKKATEIVDNLPEGKIKRHVDLFKAYEEDQAFRKATRNGSRSMTPEEKKARDIRHRCIYNKVKQLQKKWERKHGKADINTFWKKTVVA